MRAADRSGRRQPHDPPAHDEHVDTLHCAQPIRRVLRTTVREHLAREVRGMSEPWGALARVVPRATAYANRAARPKPDEPVPALRRSPWTWAQVLVDDAVVTVAHVRGRDEVHDLARLDAEARDAVDVLTRAGAFTDSSV